MGTGRTKIEIRKVENLKYRRVTFCKRRQGLFKKADQISRITGCRVAVLVFSPAMKPFLHGDVSLLEHFADNRIPNTITTAATTDRIPNTITAATTDSGSPRVGGGGVGGGGGGDDGVDDLQQHLTDEEFMNNDDDTRTLQIVPASSSTPDQHYPHHSLLQLSLAELLSDSESNLKPDGGCMEEKDDLDQLAVMKQRLEVLRERVLLKLMVSHTQPIISPAASAGCFPSK